MSIESLKEILNPLIICGINTSNPSQTTITLKETSKTKLNPILLTIPTQECLVFQLDKPQKLFCSKSNFLHPNKSGIHQGCDYIVACIHGGKWQFIFIELKSDVTNRAASQLWHTTPFINYLVELLKIHYPHCEPDPKKSIYKYLLFSTDPKDKIKTTTSYKHPIRLDSRGFKIYLGSSPPAYSLSVILHA